MYPTLIFLHGGPGFRDYLRPYFSSLEDRFKCVFFDQTRGASVEIHHLLEQLDGIVNAESGKVVLIGHSWGGVLGTEYASRYEEKLAGLVLISTGLKASQWKEEFRLELKNLSLEDAPPEKIFLIPAEEELGRPLLDSTWSSFSGETFDNLNATYLSNYDLTLKIAHIKIPILNIFGENDVRFPTRVTKTFRTLNDRIVDCEISKAGHFPFLLDSNKKKIIKLIDQIFSNR
jgi:proline iminopeptidase